jgi:hypothetical protein
MLSGEGAEMFLKYTQFTTLPISMIEGLIY